MNRVVLAMAVAVFASMAVAGQEELAAGGKPGASA